MRAKRVLQKLAAFAILSASAAYAGDLTFLAEATNPGNGKIYKAYIDLSTKHKEGAYQTVKLVSIYDVPITAAGFAGVKRMVNIYQADCVRRVKRVTYIGFLDSDGKVIVDEKYTDAKDEPFEAGTVDMKIVPYLCSDTSPR